MKDIALLYARAGIPVLWVYGLEHDEETSEWLCTCPRSGDATACSPGKHAPFGGRGAHDATTDEEMIAKWPDTTINLAIAGTDTTPILDIDDPATVAALLQPEVGLRDIATVSTTGKGLHIYLRCAPTKNAILTRKSTGEHIGELRAAGLYVVAPPSMHVSGKRYEWLGRSVLDGPTIYQYDGYAYARDLLLSVGIELADKYRGKGPAPQRETTGPIPILELPFETQNATLLSLLSPTYPTDDRSSALFHLACELVREVRTQKLTVSRETLAGIVKQVDATRIHRRGPKYALRDNADDYYWDAVIGAEEAVEAATDDDDGDTDPTLGTYYYHPKAGFIDNHNPKAPRRICNFEPVVTEVLEVWTGEKEAREDWVLKVTQPPGLVASGGTINIRLRPSERAKLKDTLLSILPPGYIVEDRMWGALETGMRWYSLGKTVHRKAYAAPGWIPGTDAFLLPAARGAVTARGIDETITFDAADVPERMLLYGLHVEPQDEVDLAEVARTLYAIAPPYIVVPLVTQVLASPLASLGADQSATLVHLFSQTGAFKTSMCRIVLSLYGEFINESRQLDSWTGTIAALSATMHRYRDLPLLIDDYKLSSRRAGITDLIQNYADRTARARQGRDQREQQYLVPRCLAISTGENIWEGQQSVRARTLLIDVSAETATPESLSPAQAMGRDGRLQALGYAWLSWLCAQGQDQLRARLLLLQEQKLAAARKTALGAEHPRVASSIASLLAVDRLFEDFLTERIPGFADEYREIRGSGWAETVTTAREHAEEAAEFSPFTTIRSAIIEAILTGQGKLAPRLNDTPPVGMMGDVVGFVDADAVWLNAGITLGWYRRQMRLQGEESTVGWTAFIQEARRSHGARRPELMWALGWGQIRLIKIPRQEFLPDGNEPAVVKNQAGDA